MCKYIVYDYSDVTKKDEENLDFSKVLKYKLSSDDVLKLVESILYGDKNHDYAFYSEDGMNRLLDLT